jgi:hypothetical protein
MRRYFYNSLASYLSLYIRPENTVVEITPPSEGLGARSRPSERLGRR